MALGGGKAWSGVLGLAWLGLAWLYFITLCYDTIPRGFKLGLCICSRVLDETCRFSVL